MKPSGSEEGSGYAGREIRWHARGGQGAITMAKVLAAAASRQGFYVQAFPEYGPERSGAPVHAYNRIAREPIQIHSGVDEPDLVLVLDATLLEAEAVTEGLQPEGILLVNTTESPQQIADRLGCTALIRTIPAAQLARQAGIRFVNVPMLGAGLRLLGLPLEAGEEALKEAFGEKLGEQLLQANLEALRLGYEAVGADTGTTEERVEGEEPSLSTSSPVPSSPLPIQPLHPTLTTLQNSTSTLLIAPPSVRCPPHPPVNRGKRRLKSWQELEIGAVILEGGSTVEIETGGWRTGLKPVVDAYQCVNCLLCWVHCPEPAILTEGAQMRGYDYKHCKGCGICADTCPEKAIQMVPESTPVPPMGWLI